MLPEVNFSYGIRNRPPTPMGRVVSNDYVREALLLRAKQGVPLPLSRVLIPTIHSDFSRRAESASYQKSIVP